MDAGELLELSTRLAEHSQHAPIEVDAMPHPSLNGVSYTEAPPLRGGQRINYTQGTTIFECTTAFGSW